MVLFVAELHKNVSSTNSEDSKWPQKFILLLSRAVTLILSRQPVVTSLRSKGKILSNIFVILTSDDNFRDVKD